MHLYEIVKDLNIIALAIDAGRDYVSRNHDSARMNQILELEADVHRQHPVVTRVSAWLQRYCNKFFKTVLH